MSRKLQFVEENLSVPCNANIYDWYSNSWPHGAKVALHTGNYSANNTELLRYHTKGVVVQPPSFVTDGKLVKDKRNDSQLVYSFPSAQLTLDFHGGGGDIVGFANVTLECNFPDDWQRLLGGESVVVSLEVTNFLNDEPDKSISYYQGGSYSLTVDWNAILDSVVLLASRKVFSNLQTQVLVQTVYGQIKPKVKLKTHIELSYHWVTNDHYSKWNDWRSTISLNALWEGSKTLISRAIVPNVSEESSFDLVSLSSTDALSSDDE